MCMISIESEINSALLSHLAWKSKLKKSIESGVLEYSIEHIKSDTNCSFGKWLAMLPDEIKNTKEFKKVLSSHSKFHVSASEIISLFLEGKKYDAEDFLNNKESSYLKNSDDLSKSIMDLKSLLCS